MTLGAILVLLGLVACSHPPETSGTAPGTTGAQTTRELDGHTFRIVEITDSGTRYETVANSRALITFTSNTFRANTGCNDITDSYSITEQGPVIASSAATLRGCPGPLAKQDTSVTRAIRTGAQITLTATSLTLRNDTVVLSAIMQAH